MLLSFFQSVLFARSAASKNFRINNKLFHQKNAVVIADPLISLVTVRGGNEDGASVLKKGDQNKAGVFGGGNGLKSTCGFAGSHRGSHPVEPTTCGAIVAPLNALQLPYTLENTKKAGVVALILPPRTSTGRSGALAEKVYFGFQASRVALRQTRRLVCIETRVLMS